MNDSAPNTRQHVEPDPESIKITVTIGEREEKLLGVLVNETEGMPAIESVIERLLDHVQQAIYRPGAWERRWLLQCIGDYWLANVEPDPESMTDGRMIFDRPRQR